MTAKWQEGSLAQLNALFERDEQVRALVLTGSLADPRGLADGWSDIDLKVILADEALERYYASSTWLAGLGTVVAEDRAKHGCTKTLRVCLVPFRRFDLTFIPQSALLHAASWEYNPFPGDHRVLWSRIPDLERILQTITRPVPFSDTAEAELRCMEESFWFKATIAIAKVVRNDLLVALHLALDLQRDCLVLQMLLRDRRLQTNVHQAGGWGNDVVASFLRKSDEEAPKGVLNMIERSCACFDTLAAKVSPTHRVRAPLIRHAIEQAKVDLDEGRALRGGQCE